MTTLAEHLIVTGVENRPLMIEKSMYDSWASRICLFIKWKKNGRMMLDSIDNGPQVYQSVEENGKERIGLIALTKQWHSYLMWHQGHMAKQCTQTKRPRNYASFKEKLLLVEAQEAGQILDEEQLASIVDRGIVKVQIVQPRMLPNYAFQTEYLDGYDSDCDDISSTKAALMANLSSYDLDVLSEVPYSNTYLNDMINQDVQEMSYPEQTHIDDFIDNKITSDSNIIPYSQYL
nr:hypothetical protein [Tanacetum cinerariifolium]